MLSPTHPSTLSHKVIPILPLKRAEEDRPGATRAGVAASVEAFFFVHRDKLVWVHLVLLVAFLVLLFLPLALPEPAEGATPLTDFTRLANFLLWGLWFPLVFISVIATGRSWCGLFCPMGAASEWANKVGLKRPVPAWLRWEGTPVVSFIVVTLLGQTVGVRDHPEAVAEVFGGTLALAILIGLLYARRKRAWCRHACPIGLLLGVFSRLGAVQFHPKRPKGGGEGYTGKGVCPTLIDLPRKRESRHCIECFRCVNPSSPGALSLRLRPPGEEIATIRDHNPNPAEVAFLFLGTGIAVGGFLWLVLPQFQLLRQRLGEWAIEREWYWIGEAGPWWLMSVHPERREVFNWLDFFTIGGFMLSAMLLLALVLATTTALSAWLAGRCGADGGFRTRFVELGYQYAPVAMISLVIGLGGELFSALSQLGIAATTVDSLRLVLFAAALLWSMRLGERILARQGVPAVRRPWPLIPGLLGTLAVGAAWWPALFGL